MALPGLVAANNLSDVADRERAWDNLGSSLATGDITIPAPSLDLNFAANKSLVDDISGNNLITFSRASSGTFMGSNGLIQTAASGVPRFDHNGATGESLGLLVEEARTNLLTYSERFDDAAWGQQNVTITPNTAIAPDGTLTGDSLVATMGSAAHGISRTVSTPASSSVSIYVKYAGQQFIQLHLGQFALTVAWANFDILNGVAGTTGGSTTSSTIKNTGNGWYLCSFSRADSGTAALGLYVISSASAGFASASTGDGVSGVHLWGAQLEAGSFPTSYIPTVASTVTRAADVVSITGANFSGWYNNSEGTLLGQYSPQRLTTATCWAAQLGNTALTGPNAMVVGKISQNLAYAETRANSITQYSASSTVATGPMKTAYGAKTGSHRAAFNGTLAAPGIGELLPPSSNSMVIGRNVATTELLNGHLSRLTYWPSRLNDATLQYITQLSVNSINIYSFSFAVKGRDVLALEDARNTSTRDFIFIKGLLSAAQPRLTAAAASTASGLTLASNALLKLAPTSSGNYFFASGLTLSGVTTRINGTNALSIATSPFSGSTATAPLLFRELRPQANWRITEPMPSGTIASPELAIPFETNDFVLFMKAGQN